MAKAKKLSYVLIGGGDEHYLQIDVMVAEARHAVHDALSEARIAYAWMIGKKPDKDGRIVLGKMKKASELDRQLHEFDAVLLLNREHWEILSEEQRRALVDHELCHLDVDVDPDTGDPRLDEEDRKLYRIRKHDLEEFRGVIERHGCYLSDIVEFVRVARKKDPNFRLFPDGEVSKGPTRIPKRDEAAAEAAR